MYRVNSLRFFVVVLFCPVNKRNRLISLSKLKYVIFG